MNRVTTPRSPVKKSKSKVRTPRIVTRPTVNMAAAAMIPVISLRPHAAIVRRVDERIQTDRSKAWLDYSLAILIAIPSFFIVAIASFIIRATSRGPALYSQTRLGRFGRPFTIYKLRTMRHNCERDGGPKWSNRGDPRVTWLGSILRKTHIDELPQLINVFRGEMSLIGPRPERPEIVTALRGSISGYDRRLAVLPGVTGFAQVHLPPDETTDCVRRKLVFDRYYVRYASFGLDLKILMLTLCKVMGLRRMYARSPKR